MASFALALLGGPAVAASSQIFPVQQSLVPAVVAGAFMLPALLAGLWSTIVRRSRGVGAMLAIGLVAVLAATAIYAHPEMLTYLRT